MSASESATWYYVKKPSGVCVRTRLTPSNVIKAQSLGWILSLTDICAPSKPRRDGTFPSSGTATEPILDPVFQFAEAIQILNLVESGKMLYPTWWQNIIDWFKSNIISPKEFLNNYYHEVAAGSIHPPDYLHLHPDLPHPVIEEPVIEEPVIEEPVIEEPVIEEPVIEEPVIEEPVIEEPEIIVTDNMVTQHVINFNIVNGRAVGSIKFIATDHFNPYYYGHNIINTILFKDPNGVVIKEKYDEVKINDLRFTKTERTELITYDEDMKGNTRALVESMVWAPAPSNKPFSPVSNFEISETEPPKPITSGFMGAGIAGAIAGLVLIGFIADHKRGK